MNDFQNVLNFVSLTQKFRGIERGILLLKEKRNENDAEHSYQLAMTAWYIATSNKLDLDINKIIKYALAHDFVEAYAGDTPIHHATQEMLKSKKVREEEAALRIKNEFPEFSELHELIHAYEERVDKESTFVYAVDKLLPALIAYLENGHTWKEHGITLDDVIEKKTKTIAVSPEVKIYFDELIAILKKSEEKYFK